MTNETITSENLAGRVDRAADWLGMDDEPRQALHATAERMAASDDWLRRLNEAIPALIDDDQAERTKSYPLPDPRCTPESDLFYAVALLASIDYPRRLHEALGVTEEVSRDTLADLLRWLDDYRQKQGRWGLKEIKWQSKFWRAKIFALGRLQFELSEYQGLARLYAGQDSMQRPLILAEDGVRVGPDGHPTASDAPDAAGQWRTTFSEADGTTIGHPVLPDGRIQLEPERRPTQSLRCLLRSGEPVLSVHIHAGGPMRYEDCTASYRQAMVFFARHVPDFDWRAMVCHSWLMDPQLSAKLKPTSNIVRFQADYHKLPNPDGEQEQIWQRVFGGRPASLDDAPRDSSLRRAILDHALAGGVWRFLTGAIPRCEVLDRFGPQCRCCRA